MGMIVLNFKYVMMVPVGCVNVPKLVSEDSSIVVRVFAGFNMTMACTLAAL